MHTKAEILALLNAPERLKNLKMLVEEVKRGALPTPNTGKDVNNHIHTQFSFSPYSPTAAAWFAWQAGLCTAGIIDHDSVAGAKEFLEACRDCRHRGHRRRRVPGDPRGTPFAD